MKKILLICIICLTASAFCAPNMGFGGAENNNEKSLDYFSNISEQGVMFFKKLRTCSPYKLLETKETIYGKTKNRMCHYSYKDYVKGDLTEHHCVIPMQTAIGYATTALDVIEYSSTSPTLANERLEQNNEIRKIMEDYCKIKVK